ncbi:MAG: bifunctional hydroxymethylpyrimidine kinase/phosphomethylpyrimidine kinase [Verrucomicrobia bacterium]|nr:bifunctional hydroxymethylpyrimidine kinase/phosphomethylpyrimidine kinase [Verrucomicrobiota bacterium]
MAIPPQPPKSGRPPVVWTIASSDPSGGAGIQADLKTFHGLGVYGATVIAGITVQNTQTFSGIEPVSPTLLRDQIRLLREDLPPAAIKLGMLPSPDMVLLVAGELAKLSATPVVCDPILKATLGEQSLSLADTESYLAALGPVCSLITPNREEAQRLAGHPVTDRHTARRAADHFRGHGFDAVVIKSLQVDSDLALDWFFDGTSTYQLTTPARPNLHTHGAGCTYSAAIAAGLAHGLSLIESIELAKAYVSEALRDFAIVGQGRGPLHHGGWPTGTEDQTTTEVIAGP